MYKQDVIEFLFENYKPKHKLVEVMYNLNKYAKTEDLYYYKLKDLLLLNLNEHNMLTYVATHTFDETFTVNCYRYKNDTFHTPRTFGVTSKTAVEADFEISRTAVASRRIPLDDTIKESLYYLLCFDITQLFNYELTTMWHYYTDVSEKAIELLKQFVL